MKRKDRKILNTVIKMASACLRLEKATTEIIMTAS